MFIKTLTVSALNSYIKKVIDSDFILNNASIKGEISNFKMHSSGHMYFSLKDEYSKINCVMFKSSALTLKFLPKDGMKVIAKGRVSVYEKDGSYQLYCAEMQPEGIGELYIAFQNLKDKLEKQGLFDLKHKKPIPEFPQKIGVVTSPTGAAIKDIINVATRRNKHIDILIYPSLVQGVNASEDIIRGIEYLNKQNVDTIILARGGGSIEELWAFNDESLASVIYNSKSPIITGVGHETDFTIADFVSDRRAPTPSAAAEIAVPNLNELNNRILSYLSTINNIINNYIKTKYSSLDLLRRELEINNPANLIINEYNRIDRLRSSIDYVIKGRISIETHKLGNLHALLSAHNPLNILSKGYSIIEDEKNNIINSIDKLKSLDNVKVTLKDGRASFRIMEEKSDGEEK